MDFNQGGFSNRAKRYRWPFAAIICFALALWSSLPQTDYLTRLSGDFLTPLASRWQFGFDTPSGYALVVIDEITHNTPPFSETPEVAWTPFLGEVISAIDKTEPKVIGLDMIFPKSIAGRTLAPGYDRTFLQALAQSGRTGRLVLAEARLSETPIRPYEGQVLAVGGAGNIRPVHLTPDADNVVRRHPFSFALEDGSRVLSFAAELAARAAWDGKAPDENILIDYVTPAIRFPTYRFSDVYACIESGETEALDVFRDKIVIIGTALDIEDRHVAGNRFVAEKDPPIFTLPCQGAVQTPMRSVSRASTAGVFIEARAVRTFLSDMGPETLNRYTVFFSSLLGLGVLALVFFKLNPASGAGVYIVYAAALWANGAWMLSREVLAPVLPWLVSAFALYVAIYAYRVFLEDQAKRWVTHAFRHYLSPSLVDRLAEEPASLKLGGERRRVAILFTDLAGFTTTSEDLKNEPEAIVAYLNQYFEILAETIEAHQGYVDKFIGDAVMGVWGAPVALENPEQHAFEAAIACLKAVDVYNAQEDVDMPINLRIGISAGEVVAGNLGSSGRFNYTVIGDAVNRAARLEPENKRHGTRLLFDESIASHLSENAKARFLDETVLRGQSVATKLYTAGEES